MQQLYLLKEENEKKINRWNINFKTKLINENEYITILSIPSWKFIAKYTLEYDKINTFEILDYIWYMHLWKSMIKNIKNLIATIIKTF